MSRSSPLVVFAAAPAGPGVTGGGNQSARNLLIGLREIGAAFRPVVQIAASNADVRPADTDYGPGLEMRLPAPAKWADPLAVSLIQRTLDDTQPDLVHLLDPIPHLGSWLAAVRDLAIPVVLTALDYNWLCVHSHLLTRRGVQCPGPADAESCLRCHFDHREFGKRTVLNVLHAVARLPMPMPLERVRQMRRTREFTHNRLESLTRDMARLDALIAPSQALAELFAANGLPREKILHVPYGTQPAAPIPFADRPPLSAGVVFGFAGRIEFDKGPDLLLDALAEIRKSSLHRPRLVAFGSPSPTGFNRRFRQRLASPQFREWTSLAQFDGKNPAAIDSAHRSIHVFAASSRWTDNLPNSVLEALQRQTPVLAPDQGSFREIVVPDRNGWLYSPEGGGGSMASKLRAILETPEAIRALPFDVVRTRLPIDEARAVVAVYAQLTAREAQRSHYQ